MVRRRFHEVCIDLDDFTDDEIRDEFKMRGLSLMNEGPIDQRDLVAAAMSDIMGKRVDRAETLLRDLIEAQVGPHLLDAFRAITDGDASLALCHLDRHIDPAPSAAIGVTPKSREGL